MTAPDTSRPAGRKAAAPDPRRLDVRRLAADGACLQGRVALAALPRLVELLAHGEGPDVGWRAELATRRVPGRASAPGLRLVADAEVALVCQRCLEPMVLPLGIDRRFVFLDDEAEAARLDESSDDEDVLALQGALDVVALLEDELILALPIVPLHDRCPQPLAPAASPDEAVVVAGDTAPAPHPFAVLAALRKPDGERH